MHARVTISIFCSERIASIVLRYAGCSDSGTSTRREPFLVLRSAISTASATAVAPSYIEALLMSMPVRRVIIVWYS